MIMSHDNTHARRLLGVVHNLQRRCFIHVYTHYFCDILVTNNSQPLHLSYLDQVQKQGKILVLRNDH
jgi:hypothetical protein